MSSSRIKVMIVDDQKLVRVSLKTTMNNAQDQILLVGEAEDGREAVEMAEKLQPDVILMDIGMPIMDGIRATQEIHSRMAHIKIIMLTTHESEENILDSFRSGANSYCLKESSPETLINVINATVNGACWIDPKIAKVVISSSIGGTPVPTGSSNLEESSTIASLTARETDVLKLITDGKNNTEISEELCLSMNTVKTHIKNIFQKLDVEDRTAAALKAIRERII